MGQPDKEYSVNVTNEMILKYEDMVHKVYLQCFSQYNYLKEDLLQCGRWGVFLAHQRYEKRAKDKCNFTVYVWLNIKTKMVHYIKHERNHILFEIDEEFDFSSLSNETPTTKTMKLDINRALDSLSLKQYTQVVQWANYEMFKDMNLGCKQNAHQHFKKTLSILKEKLKGYEL